MLLGYKAELNIITLHGQQKMFNYSTAQFGAGPQSAVFAVIPSPWTYHTKDETTPGFNVTWLHVKASQSCVNMALSDILKSNNMAAFSFPQYLQ